MKMLKKALKASLAMMFVLLSLFNTSMLDVKAAKEKFNNWEEVAMKMAEQFDGAIEDVENDEYKEAYHHMNSAYFDYYEVQGFEKNVMTFLANERVRHIEGTFSDIKHALLGNTDVPKETLLKEIEMLKVKVYRDAMVLDGKAGKSSDDFIGVKVYGDPANIPDIVKEEAKAQGIEISVLENEVTQEVEVDPKTKNWQTFTIAFGLLLREGLEAILVVVAIVMYLIKTGNKKMCRSVYAGVWSAIAASVLVAILLQHVIENAGLAGELIEGYTMFIAVVVLFYVSNWMLSKSEAEEWKEYIDDMVSESVDKNSQKTLVFAAFLAVFREGAELILFYQASFTSGMNDPKYIVYGIIAGAIVLAIVWILFRYFTVKLPLKPFFYFTSILLFLMCISFMGKGVVELTEGNVIVGRTTIPAMNGFSIPFLSVYDRAETLIPQLMLVVATIGVFIEHNRTTKRNRKKMEKMKKLQDQKS